MKRPGDKTPEPPGGRAAERLRMFENARHAPAPGGEKSALQRTDGSKTRSAGKKTRSRQHEKQTGRKK
jgi:hypothetical protein